MILCGLVCVGLKTFVLLAFSEPEKFQGQRKILQSMEGQPLPHNRPSTEVDGEVKSLAID